MSLTKVSNSMITGAPGNVLDFGASPSATASVNRFAIQAALNAHTVVYLPEGTYLTDAVINMNVGNYLLSYGGVIQSTISSGSLQCINTADDCTVDGIVFNKVGGSSRGIQVGGNNVVVKNCQFYQIGYCIAFVSCTSVLITDNYFEGTGYGVINLSAVGYVISGVTISGNRFYNVTNDAILFNTNSESYAGLQANNVTVTGNVYTRDSTITTPATESRFCGFVHGTNITVTGNTIEGTLGDSAMHYEGQNTPAGADCDDSVVISGNSFRDCVSNYARFIWLINASGNRHVVITGNTFEVTSRTSAIGASNYVLTGSVPISSNITYSDNLFRYRRDEGDTTTCYGIGVADGFAFHTLISNNQFINLSVGISNTGTDVSATKTQILGNRFVGCTYGIQSGSATYAFYGMICNNAFQSTVTYDLSFAALTLANISNNSFTSNAKSCNDKALIGLQNCRDNTNANFGRQQALAGLAGGVAASLGYIGAGINNFLINATAAWEPSSGANHNELTSIVGMSGVVTAVALNSSTNNTIVTAITYSISANILYATVTSTLDTVSLHLDIL